MSQIRRPDALTAAAAMCAGVALWCSCGVLMADAGATPPMRAGLLPPWWMLALSVAGALAIAIAARLQRQRALPLFVTAAAIVPWLPGPIPDVALLFAGPAVWYVWIAAIAGMTIPGGLPSPMRALSERLGLSGDRASLAAGAIALAVFAGAAWKVSPILPLGDEPHYLVIAQSVLKDGDLKIENNHRQEDYKAYWKGVLRPHFLRRGTNGEIYSIHMPGLPVLVLPSFVIGGYRGTQTFLILIAALATLVTWRAARVVTGDVPAAWFASAAVAGTIPFLFLTFTAFPDGVGAALVMTCVAALVSLDPARLAAQRAGVEFSSAPARRSIWWWAGLGLSCALLPWMHPRYVVLAVSLGAILLARIQAGPRPARAAAAFLALPALSAIAWFGYFLVIYGSLDPSSAYGRYTQMAAGNIARGLPGLIFDQQFGLLPNAPVYALAILGIAPLFRSRRRLVVELAVLLVPYTMVTAAYQMWWGGSSSPARFLGPILLVLSLPIAAAWSSATRRSTRAIALALLAVSLALTGAFVLVEHGRFAFNTRDGLALWAGWAAPAVNAARGLPSFFRTSLGTSTLEAAVWMVCGLIAWLAARRIESRSPASAGLTALVSSASLVVLAGTAVAASWRIEGARGLAPNSSQLVVLRAAAAGTRPVAVKCAPFGPASVSDLTHLIRLRAAGTVGTATETLLLFPRVPAGRYRLSLHNQVPDASLSVWLSIGRETQPIASWEFAGLGAGPVGQEFDLPVDVRSISIRAQTNPPRAISEVWLDPIALGPPSGQAGALYAMSARRYGPLVVYGVGEDVYLEAPGIWTGAEAIAELVIVAEGHRSAQRLRLRAGPVRTTATLEAGEWRQAVVLEPGQEREIALPIAQGGATRVRVRTDQGFRPSDTDPRSTDGRYLGVWIEFP